MERSARSWENYTTRCFIWNSAYKLPYKHWQFNFFYSKELPAVVTFAFFDDGEMWRTAYRYVDATRPSHLSVGKWSNSMGTFGAYYNQAKALPVIMRVCWDSLIDKKAYETEVRFGRDASVLLQDAQITTVSGD